ncbi:MAG: hypothetical protein IPH48_22235 [bacterium]|jgi:hypothetical protein|nr:hypothetical protein [bacterium]
MLNRRIAAHLLMLMTAACLVAGCSDDSTAPDDNDPAPAAHLWSARFGDADTQMGYAIAVDAAGNMIVAGVFEGAIDFGGGPLTCVSDIDVFIAKFGPDGAHLWSRRFGGTGSQSFPAIAVDDAGQVFLAGMLHGAVDFGGGALVDAGDGDAFVAKFTPNGAHIWSRRFGDANQQYVSAIGVDDSGQVIITGLLSGTADFGGGPLTSAGDKDIFVAKFDANGAHLWSRRMGDTNLQVPTSIAVDHSGQVAVAGAFIGSVDFGGGALTSAGDYDIFLAKLGSSGEHIWSRRFGDAGTQVTVVTAVDELGNVILAGGFDGSMDFDGGALVSAGNTDIFVAKFGPGGDYLWRARYGDAEYQSAEAVTVDALGNVIITGAMRGSADFGGGLLTSAGQEDLFVARMGSDGAPVWSRRFGDAAIQSGYGVAVDASENVCVTGLFLGSIDFGGVVLTSAGSLDACVVKLAP